MRWPLDNYTISQGFSSGHQGVDLAAPKDAPIRAPESGVVTAVNNVAANYFGGLYIKMRGDSGHIYYLGHNNKNVVAAGQRVAEGQLIGYVGMTIGPGGSASGPHVHFEMSKDGKMLDARKIIKEVKMTRAEAEKFRYAMRVINSEVKGWNETEVHSGKNDEAEIKYLMTLDNDPATAFAKYSQQGWNEGAKLRAERKAIKAERDALKKQLAANGSKSTAIQLKPGTYIVK